PEHSGRDQRQHQQQARQNNRQTFHLILLGFVKNIFAHGRAIATPVICANTIPRPAGARTAVKLR
ncbi:MAG: hypothetical protein LC774_17175, partial [Acidobacteria bacterium]|nr:hypothetical protein [Acidobacteriota bacterium]